MSYKIVYDKNSCIGVGQCATMSNIWSMTNRGKAELKDAKEVSPGIFELEIPDEAYSKELQAANSCPVSAIKIVKVE
ncbi:MAG: ferredoxin [Nanoarchaeota archaeon]|nr:ferredoxin [Nanoarchaeota archaeon]